MTVIEALKIRRLLTRPLIIALSITVLAVLGFGMGLRLPAMLLSALLFAGSYLLEPVATQSLSAEDRISSSKAPDDH